MTTQKTTFPEIIPDEEGKVPFIGGNCAMFRAMNGWNQDDLGDRLNVTQQTVSSYERSKKLPLAIVQEIAKIFGIHIYYLTKANKKELKQIYQSNVYDSGQNTNVLYSDNIHVYPTNDVKEGFKGQVDLLKSQLDKMEQQYNELLQDNVKLQLRVKELECKG